MTFIKINEIGPGEEGLNIIAKVISVEEVKGKTKNMIRCVVGDSTGVVNAFFPDSEHLTKGNSVAIFGAEGKVVREHI